MTKEQTVRLIGSVMAAFSGALAANLYLTYWDWNIIAVCFLSGISGIIYGADND